MSFFDVRTPEGQFHALAALYLVIVSLVCLGFKQLEQDHTLIAGALLTLLRQYSGVEGK